MKNLLRNYGIADDMRVIHTGSSPEYERIFKQMIQELQRCQADYKEMLVILLQQIFISVHRYLTTEHKLKNDYLDAEMEAALEYFNEHYNTELCIEEYARSKGMSVSWFIRNFKQYTGTTPMQYIVAVRIANAQMLLETTHDTVTEIGHIVGYENPLYFSRIFKKQKGLSPSEYRKQIKH